MMSFTGSTRAGIEVARNAAPTVKRVAQELGGKSANIILDDADFEEVIARDMAGDVHELGPVVQRADPHARAAARAWTRPRRSRPRRPRTSSSATRARPASNIGPVVSETQYGRIQQLIEKGIGEGAKLEVGGPGKPEGLETGYYVQPTVFSHVSNDMTIAQRGDLRSGARDDRLRGRRRRRAHRQRHASTACRATSPGRADRAKAMARRIRSGNVHVNGAGPDFNAPFGGYRQSGNGREWGALGFEEYLETKAIMGAV